MEFLPESNPLKFVLALVVVLALAVLILWAIRRFGADRLAASAARGRQPRLGVVDQVSMPDGRRKLVIVRRDNVEHLVMIGGPTDVVVEQNIVRATGAQRDKAEPALSRSLSVSETLTRPVPLGESTPFPLQPDTNSRAPRTTPEEPVQWTWPAPSEPAPPPRPEPRLERPEPLAAPPIEPPLRPTAPREPAFSRPVTPPPAPRPAPVAPAPVVAPAAEKTEKITAVAEPDSNLAEMASMLESSLRRPMETRPSLEPAKPAKAEPPVATPAPHVQPPEPKPVKNEPKAVFESLEEEMANLLGRPPGKT